jgi:hypothetical protein
MRDSADVWPSGAQDRIVVEDVSLAIVVVD